MFFLPLYDDNPTRRPPVVTWMLVAACVMVFFWQVSLPAIQGRAAVFSFGVIPAVLFGHAELPPELRVVPGWASIFSSMFMHGSVLHLGGNMLYLWIFGNNVEDSMGRGRFLLFYLICGTAAALGQGLADPYSQVPMIGASGAIGGVLGAYLMLHPHANVRVLMWIVIIVRLINVPALVVLGVWFAGQVMSGAMTPIEGGQGGVAFWAHVGGFVAGAALIPFFKRKDVPLFDRSHSRPFEVVVPRSPRRGSVPPSGSRRWPPEG